MSAWMKDIATAAAEDARDRLITEVGVDRTPRLVHGDVGVQRLGPDQRGLTRHGPVVASRCVGQDLRPEMRNA